MNYKCHCTSRKCSHWFKKQQRPWTWRYKVLCQDFFPVKFPDESRAFSECWLLCVIIALGQVRNHVVWLPYVPLSCMQEMNRSWHVDQGLQ